MSAFWTKAEINFVSLTDPTDTFILKVTNRPAEQGDADHLPVLLFYSGLSLAVGQDGMPRSSGGTITLADSFWSLGFERRIFDLFDRYTPINQTVTVYRAFDSVTETDLPTSWTLFYTGKVQRPLKGKDSLVFEVSTDLLPDLKLGTVITEDFAPDGSDTNIPDSSLGKTLPFVFAETDRVLVPAYNIRDLDLTEFNGINPEPAYYAFSSCRTPFVDTSVTYDLLAKDLNGDYVKVDAASYSAGGSAGGNAVTSHGTTEFLVPFAPEFATLVTGVAWECKGQNNVGITPVGKIIAKLYRTPIKNVTYTNTAPNGYIFSEDLFDWEEIASGEINKSAYLTQVRGAFDFVVVIDFDKPIPIGYRYSGGTFFSHEYYYAIGIVLTNYSGSSTTDFTSAANNAITTQYYTRVSTNTAGNWLKVTAASPRVQTTTVDTITIGQSTTPEKDYLFYSLTPYINPKCDCSQLEMAVLSQGARDNSPFDITGGSYYISRPDHVIKYLTTTYDSGSSEWVLGNLFDFTTFDYSTVFDGNYYRRVRGFTQGDQTLLEVISTIVREMCCALVPLSNGKLALWAWGGQTAVSKVFTDADIIELSTISETDVSTVINSIKIKYGENFTQVFDQWEATGEAANIAGVIEANKDTSGDFANLLKSYQIYGNRELEETAGQFIGDYYTALTRAKYLAYRQDHTHRTFTITVDLEGNESLKLMDIVDVLSANLPAYFGSSNNATLPTYSGSSIDIYSGEYARRLQRRRCQIIGINNDYDGQFPKLQIELREIKPRHLEDPTAEDI